MVEYVLKNGDHSMIHCSTIKLIDSLHVKRNIIALNVSCNGPYTLQSQLHFYKEQICSMPSLLSVTDNQFWIENTANVLLEIPLLRSISNV